jgi:hypothetical protein
VSKTVEDMIEENDVQQISSLRSARTFAGISCGVVVGQFLCAIECGLGHQILEASFERELGSQNAVEIPGRKSASSLEIEIPNLQVVKLRK